jgi:hypothetical protein
VLLVNPPSELFSRALLTQRFAEAPPPIRRLLPFACALLGPSAPLATGASWADFASVEGTQHTAGLPARAGAVLHVV